MPPLDLVVVVAAPIVAKRLMNISRNSIAQPSEAALPQTAKISCRSAAKRPAITALRIFSISESVHAILCIYTKRDAVGSPT